MSDDDIELSMTLPLDSDGFLRRACSTCDREFKWLVGESSDDGDEDASVPVPDGGYFCPYCGVQAPSDSWNTEAQMALGTSILEREALAPMLDDFAKSLGDVGRQSGGLLSFEVSTPDAQEPLTELTEEDDMLRIDFECHPTEPVKVLDSWTGPVRCLCCGETAA